MSAFSPLVPSVNKYKPFLLRVVFYGPITGCLQPPSIKTWTGVGIYRSSTWFSGFTIPAREDRFIKWIWSCGFDLTLLIFNHLWVTEYIRRKSGFASSVVPCIIKSQLCHSLCGGNCTAASKPTVLGSLKPKVCAAIRYGSPRWFSDKTHANVLQ